MKRGIILVLLTAIISGISIFINQFGVKGIDSTLFTFTKNIIVSVFILIIILGLKEYKNISKLTKKDWLSLILIGLIGGAIPFVLFFKGLQLSAGATGSFIHKTMFIFVAIIAMIFLKEKLSKKILIPALILLTGNFLLLKVTAPVLNLGTFLIFIATLFWAAENTYSKQLLKTIEPKILAFSRLFFGSMFILIYMAIIDKVSLIPALTIKQFSWILITVPFLLGYVLTWYSGLKEIKVTTATSILLLGSPITTLLSCVFLGATMTLSQALGLGLVLVGIITVILLTETHVGPTISTA